MTRIVVQGQNKTFNIAYSRLKVCQGSKTGFENWVEGGGVARAKNDWGGLFYRFVESHTKLYCRALWPPPNRGL